MAQLFDRRVAVYVDALKVTDLRVQFKIERTYSKEPNTGEVTISNLGETSRAAMQKKGSRVIVEAGYAETIAQIFYGDSRTIDHVKTGPTWETKIQAGEGERAFRHVRINESFKGGTPVSSVLRTVVLALQRFGCDPGNAFTQIENVSGQFVQGYTAHGRASDQLTSLLKNRGFDWSFQGNRLQILAEREVVKRTAVYLSPETGLIGSPQHSAPEKKENKPPVLKAKSLLQPEIYPGRLVQIISDSTRGLFKAHKVTHTGDTAGGPWETEFEAIPTQEATV